MYSAQHNQCHKRYSEVFELALCHKDTRRLYNSMKCQANVKYGPNKGRRCSCPAKQDGLCGRHCIKHECSICLTVGIAVQEAKCLPCCHKFHDECVQKWLLITPSCPMCRAPMIHQHSRSDVLIHSSLDQPATTQYLQQTRQHTEIHPAVTSRPTQASGLQRTTMRHKVLACFCCR